MFLYVYLSIYTTLISQFCIENELEYSKFMHQLQTVHVISSTTCKLRGKFSRLEIFLLDQSREQTQSTFPDCKSSIQVPIKKCSFHTTETGKGNCHHREWKSLQGSKLGNSVVKKRRVLQLITYAPFCVKFRCSR